MPGACILGSGIACGLAWPPVREPGEHVGQQPGRRAEARGQVVQRCLHIGGGTLQDGRE
jgi:hypothetical protein